MTQKEKPKSTNIISHEPEAVGLWIKEITQRWSNLPAFQVDKNKLKHLAIICDGNRRAATQKDLPPFWGHRAGVEVIKGLIKAGNQWGINNLTFWVWSTENWQRSKKQVDFVMDLAGKFLKEKNFTNTFIEHQTRFVHLGKKDRLPPSVQKGIKALEKNTAAFHERTVNLAMDYGGSDEIARAIIRLVQQRDAGRFNLDDLEKDPNTIFQFLDTKGQYKPDLVIRTGTTMSHTSGFMPLQTEYASWDFMKIPFPNLQPKQIIDSLEKFTSYKKRMGK